MCDVNGEEFFCQKIFRNGLNMSLFLRAFVEKTVYEGETH